MKSLLLTTAASLLITPTLLAEAYDLSKGGKLPEGYHTKSTMNISMKGDASLAMGEQEMQMKMTATGTEVEEIEVTSANSLTLKVHESTMNTKVTMDGMPPQDQVETEALSGCSLSGSLEDGTWKLKLTEGEAEDAVVEAKQVSFNAQLEDDRELFGGEKRAVGDTWEINSSALPNFGPSGEEEPEMEGKGQAKFAAIEEVDGARCAKITVDFEGGAADEEMPGAKMTLKGTFTFWRDLKLKVDRKGEFKGKMLMDGPMSMTADMQVEMKTEVL